MTAGKLRRACALCGFAPVLGFAVWTAIRGADFGFHWDESRIISSVRRSVASGTLLPGSYNYGSVSFYLPFVALIPRFVMVGVPFSEARLTETQDALVRAAAEPAFSIRVRTVFIVASLLAIAWVYLAVYLWRQSWPEALIAALALSLSWEINYHARWIAPDAVVAQWSALAMLCLVRARTDGRAPNRRWLCVGAAVAGLACGTKYPAGLLVSPFALLVVARADLSPRWRVTTMGALAAAFGASCLVSTPGTLLEPFAFWRDVFWVTRAYSGWFGGYNVQPGLGHLWRQGVYVFLVLFSAYPVIAGVMAAFACAGMVSLWREDNWTTITFVCGPTLYMLLFCGQSVMIVRNYLLVAPFAAVLVARGVATAYETLQWRVLRLGLSLGLLACAGMNGWWLIHASTTIMGRNTTNQVQELALYLAAHPGQRYVFSKRIAHDLFAFDGAQRSTAAVTRDGDVVVAYLRELNLVTLASNVFGGYWLLPSGPFEVNLNYYGSWAGQDRVVLMKPWVGRAAQVVD
jgi:hypothetical protein